MNQFRDVEVLILRDLGLTKIDDFILPKVRYVDISENLIAEASSLRKVGNLPFFWLILVFSFVGILLDSSF